MFLLWICVAENTNKKILLIPVQVYSHVMEVTYAVSELAGRGYELHMVVSEAMRVPDKVSRYRINVMRYRTKHSVVPFMTEDFIRGGVISSLTDSTEDDQTWTSKTTQLILEDCKDLMADRELVQNIRNMHFDLAVVDMITISPCIAILPYNLSIPFVTVGTDFVPSYHGNRLFHRLYHMRCHHLLIP